MIHKTKQQLNQLTGNYGHKPRSVYMLIQWTLGIHMFICVCRQNSLVFIVQYT